MTNCNWLRNALLFVAFAIIPAVGCSAGADVAACKEARAVKTLAAWKQYLATYPQGACWVEANAAIERLNEAEAACEEARQCERKASALTNADARRRARIHCTTLWATIERLHSEGSCLAEAKEAIAASFEVNAKADHESAVAMQLAEMREVIWEDSSAELDWQRNPPAELLTWEAAKELCANLSLNGIDDWHLPTSSELRTLTQGEQGKAAACTWSAALRGACGGYWSSTSLAGDTTRAEGVDFADGARTDWAKSQQHRVRCVR